MLYESYADRLYAFGKRYTVDDGLIKDSIHDLFIDVWFYRRTLARHVNVRFYLFSSYKRKLQTCLKKYAAFQPAREPGLHEFTLVYSAEDRIIEDEQQRGVYHALVREMNLLPPRQKEALYLKYNQQFSYQEAASLMRISVPTCRTLVYRAIRELREKLETVPARGILLWMLLQ